MFYSMQRQRDGSSRFGSDNQFHDFGHWAADGFSRGGIYKESTIGVEYGKLRISYGTTGMIRLATTHFSVCTIDHSSSSLSECARVKFSGNFKSISPMGRNQKDQFGHGLWIFKDRLLINANYYRTVLPTNYFLRRCPALPGRP